MNDDRKTKAALVAELKRLRTRVNTLQESVERRRLSQMALNEYENRYRSIFENSDDAILLTVPDGRIVAANPAACEMFGRTEAELCRLGRNATVDPTDPRLAEAIRRRERTGRFKGELTHLRRDGRPFPAEVTGSVFRDRAGHQMTSMIIRDITDRKHSEGTLALIGHTIRSIGECVSITDVGNKILFVNDAFLRTYGYTPTELIGKPVSIVRSTTTEPAADDILHATLQGGWQGELVNRKKDGTEFPIELSTSIVRDDKGHPIALVGIATDITERKLAEKALQTTTVQLRELAQHLQNVREEEKKRLSQEFHDQLGQTLTALKMDLAMLQRRVTDTMRELSRSDLEVEIQAMQHMIDQAIGSIREIMSELRPELLDQLGIVPALEWEAERFGRHGGTPCEFKSTVANLEWDAKRSIALFRIFQEALTNVSRHAQATLVRATVRVDEGNLYLEIKDNGVGISAEMANRSSSFGLIGMRERALLLGGSLEIKGVKGEGTTIFLRIPLATAGPEGESET